VRVAKRLFLVVSAKKAGNNAGIFRRKVLESHSEARVSVLQLPLVNDIAQGVNDMIPYPEDDFHFGLPGGHRLGDLKENTPFGQVKGPSDNLKIDPAFGVLVGTGDKVQRLQALEA